MNKRDFFIKALNAKRYIFKEWTIEAFAITELGASNEQRQIGLWLGTPEGVDPNSDTPYHYYSEDGTGELIPIEGSSRQQRLFDFQDPLTLEPDDLPNVKERVETTYGVALINAMILCYPFNGKIAYVNDNVISGRKLDSLVAKRLVDYPVDGKEREPDKIYIDELLKYQDALTAIAGLSQLCTVAATAKTMTINPAILKRRDELFEQHKHEMHRPDVLAAIDKELTELDRKDFAGDPAEQFFIKDNSFKIGRKKAHISYGLEEGFGAGITKPVFIKGPLRDGLDFNDLPSIADASRSGSYSRGKETALGGESVKYFYRVFQNTKISEEDCGAIHGLYFNIDEHIWKDLIGRSIIVNGKSTPLTEDDAKQCIGKRIEIRSPYLCKTEAPSYCAMCAGKALAMNPTGVHVEISDVGSAFLGLAMSKMHGSVLATAKYQYKTALT